MRHDKDKPRKYEISNLMDHHKENARLILMGYAHNKDIAEMVGLGIQQVSNIRNSKVFKDNMDILQAARDADSLSVARRIASMAPKAVMRLDEVIDKPINAKDNDLDPALIARVAGDILDRAGHGGINKVMSLHMTPDEIKKMKEDAIKSGMIDGSIVKSNGKQNDDIEDAHIVNEELKHESA